MTNYLIYINILNYFKIINSSNQVEEMLYFDPYLSTKYYKFSMDSNETL